MNNQIPWRAAILLNVYPPNYVEVALPGSTQTMRVTTSPLDIECLQLFQKGTVLLAQILQGVLVDWTFSIRVGDTKPPQLPGDEWKNA